MIPEEEIINYCPNIKGVIQVGAHIGEEIPIFFNKFKCSNVVVFEPDIDSFNLIPNYDNLIKVNSAVGSSIGKSILNVASNKQSSSLLKPKTHLQAHPWVTFGGQKEVQLETLDHWFATNNIGNYNFLSIDVQGYEKEVLLGSKNILQNIDYILCEVNCKELYENCAMVEDIDTYLSQYGFSRIKTVWYEDAGWGDALYIKNENSTN